MCCILIVIESNNPRAHISTGVLLHMYELAHQCSRLFLVLSFSLYLILKMSFLNGARKGGRYQISLGLDSVSNKMVMGLSITV